MKKVFLCLFTFLFICFFKSNVFAAVQVAFPNDDLKELYAVRSDTSLQTTTYYARFDNTRHLFFSVPSENTLYIVRENEGTLERGAVVVKDNSSAPDKIYLNEYSFEIKEDWEVLYKPYIYSLNYYPGQLLINAQEFESEQEFINHLKSFSSFEELVNATSADFGGGAPSTGRLPMLHFSLEKKHVPGFPNLLKIKEIFKWSYTEYEIYKSNPSGYFVEIVASTNLKDAPTGIGKVFDAYTWSMNDLCKYTVTSGTKYVSVNQYSFMYDDIGEKIYEKLGESWEGSTCGYYLYIRTRSADNTQSSYWKVYKVCFGGYVSQMGIVIDESGNISDLDEGDWDIREDTDNGEFDEDNSDDASEDPGSDFYDETGISNASTVVANLRSIVTTLGEIPQLISMVFSWMPNEIIALISIGIGLIVVVGIVKWVL